MEKFEIFGGYRLNGIIENQGSKNAALPILVASLLTDEEVIVKAVPDTMDVRNMLNVLRIVGAKVRMAGDIRINAYSVKEWDIANEAAKKIRSTLLLPAALLSKFGRVKIPQPGGDSIGTRKIDAWVTALRALGAKVKIGNKVIDVKIDTAKGTKVKLDFPSVTATESIIISASMAEGKTIVTNVAKEPEIIDLSNFLNSMGAKIQGAGTNVIKITGVKNLHGSNYTIIPDRIAAGTYMIAAAITRGNLLIRNVVPSHLRAVINKLRKTGVKISDLNHEIRVECEDKFIKATDITTSVYPGFPTDIQPMFTALMTTASGTSIIKETLYDGRFTHVNELRKMGAIINVKGNVAIVNGKERLRGAEVRARDIRGGAALTLAGLVAEGVTEVFNVYEIDRGYNGLDDVLSKVGAEIKRVKG